MPSRMEALWVVNGGKHLVRGAAEIHRAQIAKGLLRKGPSAII